MKEYTFESFQDIIARLRAEDGCPWDRAQTHESLRDCMIEEAYEVAEGIDIYHRGGGDDNLCEELGDVLLQVVMHARIGEEEGRFNMEDVLRGISEKMIRRHPHVFGGESPAESPEQVLENWEEIKRKEKQEKTRSESMRRVAKTLPANIRASKIQKKAAENGCDFLAERAAAEVQKALEAVMETSKKGNVAELFEEFGSLMFNVVNLSRILNINAENALTNAVETFINKFEYIEETAEKQGLSLHNVFEDRLWSGIKHSK